QRSVERLVLPEEPVEACGNRSVRRAPVLCRTLRYGRGEHDVLRAAARGGHARMGCSHTRRLRLLAEAVSEVHAPEDVPRGGAEERPGRGRRAARSTRPGAAV